MKRSERFLDYYQKYVKEAKKENSGPDILMPDGMVVEKAAKGNKEDM